MSLLGYRYPKIIPYVKFEHFWIIRFLVMLRTNRQTDRQTNRRTRAFYTRRPYSVILLVMYKRLYLAGFVCCNNKIMDSLTSFVTDANTVAYLRGDGATAPPPFVVTAEIFGYFLASFS